MLIRRCELVYVAFSHIQKARQKVFFVPYLWSEVVMLHRKQMQPNWSAHSDMQQQIAAARRMLRAGGLKR